MSEEKKEKVITGAAAPKEKFLKSLFLGDLKDIGVSIVESTVKPAIRGFVYDVGTSFIGMFLYGNDAPLISKNGLNARPGYSKVSTAAALGKATPISSQSKPMQASQTIKRFSDYENIIFDPSSDVYRQKAVEELTRTRGAADEWSIRSYADKFARDDAYKTQAELLAEIEQYGVVSLATLCDLLGWPSDFPEQKWGWTALGMSTITNSGRCYILKLPKVESIV